MNDDVLTITRGELQEKMSRGDNFKLVMTLSAWAYEQKRIPGSIRLETKEDLLRALRKDDEIVVYCTNPACRKSVGAYRLLVEAGYERVRRYAGGVADWEEAGLPLEGTEVASRDAASLPRG